MLAVRLRRRLGGVIGIRGEAVIGAATSVHVEGLTIEEG